jgi:lipopolysaccharide transport system permease protein
MAELISLTITSKPDRLFHHFSPVRMVKNLWLHRDLIGQITLREIMGRYRGSYLGSFWAIINPILLLGIFTFVFSVIFQAKWGGSVSDSKEEFALTLFCGLIIYNAFSECLNRAPGLILGNASYVKKTNFPVEILPVTVVLSACFNMLIGFLILIGGILIFLGFIRWTILYLPLVVFAVLILTLGLTWFISSLGVFIRDICNLIPFFTMALFFLTPIFYPITAVPPGFQALMSLNPLSVIIENNRRILMGGQSPDWRWFSGVILLSAMVMVAGYGFFIKSKRAFADVI